jgi:Ca2+-binding EF-hand superfamily protein
MDDLRALLNDEAKFNEVAQIAFQTTDTDGSGVVERPELEKAMTQISEDIGIAVPSKEEVDEVFNALDADKSGKLDYAEFKIFVRRIFEAMLD